MFQSISTCCIRFICFLLVAIGGVQPVQSQEKDFAELQYAKRLSKQFPDSAFLLLKEVYTRSLEKKDKLATATCLQQMGQISYYLGNYPQALDFHLQADKIFREENSLVNIAANLNDMGILYYYNKQLGLARKQYDEALQIYQRIHNGEGTADTYGRIGHLYEKRQQYDSAFYYQRMALSQYNSISQKQGMAKIYENMGSIYEDLERYDSAQSYFSRSLALYNEAHEGIASIEVLNNLGDIYRKTGKYAEALVQTRQALSESLKVNDLYQIGAAYRDLGKTYHLLKQYDSAYYYLELSRRNTIDIYSKENNRQTAFLNVLYDIGKKNAEIISLGNQQKINRVVTIATIVVIALFIVLGWVTFSRQKLKIRNEQMEAAQTRRLYETQKEIMELEIKNKAIQETKLMEELDTRSKELSKHTLHIIQKNKLVDDLRERLEVMVKDDKRDQKRQLQQLIHQINLSANQEQHWSEFREIFEQVHQQFFDKLKEYCNELTGNDMRLVALIKLNMASKDMATLLGISMDSLRVARYRLRKKINLTEGESLTSFIQSI
ncbi:MAG: tetratricopeptide repeat protein [Filimonas sp.]|nr:tetratricopeptide repeat protein [Filimonas sp.]